MNVISTSLFFPENKVTPKTCKYVIGLFKSIKAMPKIFPTFILIIHHDLSIPEEIFNKLKHIHFIKLIFHPREKGLTLTAARFLPIPDLDIETFLVRDLDEILNENDSKLIQSWILNNQTQKNEKEKKNILSYKCRDPKYTRKFMAGFIAYNRTICNSLPWFTTYEEWKKNDKFKEYGMDEIFLEYMFKDRKDIEFKSPKELKNNKLYPPSNRVYVPKFRNWKKYIEI